MNISNSTDNNIRITFTDTNGKTNEYSITSDNLSETSDITTFIVNLANELKQKAMEKHGKVFDKFNLETSNMVIDKSEKTDSISFVFDSKGHFDIKNSNSTKNVYSYKNICRAVRFVFNTKLNHSLSTKDKKKYIVGTMIFEYIDNAANKLITKRESCIIDMTLLDETFDTLLEFDNDLNNLINKHQVLEDKIGTYKKKIDGEYSKNCLGDNCSFIEDIDEEIANQATVAEMNAVQSYVNSINRKEDTEYLVLEWSKMTSLFNEYILNCILDKKFNIYTKPQKKTK